MTFKIEQKPVVTRYKSGVLREFVLTLKKLKAGESFLCPEANASNFRMAISVAQMLLDIEITTRTEGKNIRIARIS